jgi:hypothetical protein
MVILMQEQRSWFRHLARLNRGVAPLYECPRLLVCPDIQGSNRTGKHNRSGINDHRLISMLLTNNLVTSHRAWLATSVNLDKTFFHSHEQKKGYMGFDTRIRKSGKVKKFCVSLLMKRLLVIQLFIALKLRKV